MSERRSVVVADVSTPERFARCLRQVIRTVGSDVEIVAVSSGFSALAPALRRRVRLRAVTGPDAVEGACADEVARDGLVVVLRSDCGLRAGWFDRVCALADQYPLCVIDLSHLPTPLRAYPPLVRSGDAPGVTVEAIPGVRPRGVPHTAPEHPAGEGRPVIAASMIVKDEESAIGASIRSIRPFVDEVVVYDTGSSDGTVALARAAGATVIEGYWDDDFGAARNRALEHCRTEWVLVVDADEVLEGDPAQVRAWLAGRSADLVRVTLVNASWSGVSRGQTMRVVRLFRRSRGHWSGALHEEIVARDLSSPLVMANEPAPLRVIHHGYVAGVAAVKDKAARNLRLARAAIDAGDDSCAAWSNFGRALAQSGDHAAALEALRNVPERAGDDGVHVLSARTALLCLGASDHPGQEAESWIGELERHGESPAAVAVHRARLAMAMGDLDRAERLLDGVGDDVDLWGLPVDPAEVGFAAMLLLVHRGESARAWAAIVDLAIAYPDRVPLAQLLSVGRDAGIDLSHIVAVMPSELLERSLRECIGLHPEDADRWLEAVWGSSPSASVIVTAGVLAARLPFDRVLEWELRAMQAGVPDDAAPLALLCADAGAEVTDRLLAAAIRWEVQSRPAAEEDFRRLLDGLDPREAGRATARLIQHAPQAASLARRVLDDIHV